jgi:hypothetical protein
LPSLWAAAELVTSECARLDFGALEMRSLQHAFMH